MAKKKQKTPAFEELMDRLEGIADELESGELGLEKAIERYEEGVKCYRQCHGVLTGAEKKVEILTRTKDGKLKAEPFEGSGEPGQSAEDSDDDSESEEPGAALF